MANTEMVPLEQELDRDRTDRFAEAILTTGSIEEAAKAAAYSETGSGYVAASRETVQKKIRTKADRQVKTELLGLAIKTVKGLMKNGNPPAVQLGAAKMVFAMNGMLDPQADDGRDKPLHEMTEAQLHRFIERAEKAAKAGGSPTIITVTPDEGA